MKKIRRNAVIFNSKKNWCIIAPKYVMRENINGWN